MMRHGDFIADVQVDAEAGILFGRVVNTRSVITFQGRSVEEASQAFRDSIEDYLDFCAQRGVSPEKPFSGKFLIRMPPAVHSALASKAALAGESLNQFANRVLANEVASDAAVAPHDRKKSGSSRAEA